MDEIDRVKTLSNLLQTRNLENAPSRHAWINMTTSLVIVTILLAIIIYFGMKKYRSARKPEKEASQKIEEPLFSALIREEL
ncbi:unnamed protein product [Diabrotica balteata]|uniref:Uncharacterized protein n=1 Tax=Diabrotica balteata TaxID=107213 RepID=A0A9N9SX64_DIABA|nr:unnamed protein product [Diabrotica balteata]